MLQVQIKEKIVTPLTPRHRCYTSIICSSFTILSSRLGAYSLNGLTFRSVLTKQCSAVPGMVDTYLSSLLFLTGVFCFLDFILPASCFSPVFFIVSCFSPVFLENQSKTTIISCFSSSSAQIYLNSYSLACKLSSSSLPKQYSVDLIEPSLPKSCN